VRSGSLCLVALLGLTSCGPPPAVEPDPSAELPAELRGAIERELAEVRAAPGDARARATLGLVYAANHMWSEARRSYGQAGALEASEPLWSYHAALARLHGGDPDGALAEFERAAQRFPDFAPLWYRLGDLSMENGDLEAAEARMQRVIELAPRAPEGHAALGAIALERGEAAAARAACERALALDPDYRPARYVLGLALARLGLVQQAEQALAAGVDARKRHLPDAWSERGPFHAVLLETRLEAAIDWMEAGRLDDALKLLSETLALHPEAARVQVNLGVAHARAGNTSEAIDRLERVAAAGSREAVVFLNLAECYLASRREKDALSAADRALAIDVEFAGAHVARGEALISLGRADEGRAVLARAARLDRGDTRTPLRLAQLAVEAREWVVARSWFLELSAREPERWQNHANVVRVCLELDDLVQAEQSLAAARKRAPEEASLVDLARELARRRRP
jgi:tetratricopeptide (TPR) repeat protein